MAAFFSGTDDKYELTDPGIHIVVGTINKQTRRYTLASSVVAGGRRFHINYNELIDATPVENVTFHENVLNFIEYDTPTYHKNRPKSYSYQNSIWQEKVTTQTTKRNKFDDPFHYSEGNDFDSFEAFWEYQESQRQSVKLHQVEDIIADYIHLKKDSPDSLRELMNTLLNFVDNLEESISEELCI